MARAGSGGLAWVVWRNSRLRLHRLRDTHPNRVASRSFALPQTYSQVAFRKEVFFEKGFAKIAPAKRLLVGRLYCSPAASIPTRQTSSENFPSAENRCMRSINWSNNSEAGNSDRSDTSETSIVCV